MKITLVTPDGVHHEVEDRELEVISTRPIDIGLVYRTIVLPTGAHADVCYSCGHNGWSAAGKADSLSALAGLDIVREWVPSEV